MIQVFSSHAIFHQFGALLPPELRMLEVIVNLCFILGLAEIPKAFDGLNNTVYKVLRQRLCQFTYIATYAINQSLAQVIYGLVRMKREGKIMYFEPFQEGCVFVAGIRSGNYIGPEPQLHCKVSSSSIKQLAHRKQDF